MLTPRSPASRQRWTATNREYHDKLFKRIDDSLRKHKSISNIRTGISLTFIDRWCETLDCCASYKRLVRRRRHSWEHCLPTIFIRARTNEWWIWEEIRRTCTATTTTKSWGINTMTVTFYYNGIEPSWILINTLFNSLRRCSNEVRPLSLQRIHSLRKWNPKLSTIADSIATVLHAHATSINEELELWRSVRLRNPTAVAD